MRVRSLISLAQFCCLASVATAAFSAPETPMTIPGIETADSTFVAKAVEGKSALLVDTRNSVAFSKGTISGAINCAGIQQDPTEITEAEVNKASAAISNCSALGGGDKARVIVTFCKDTQCWISAKAALALSKQGFTNVKWYRAGFENWKAEGR